MTKASNAAPKPQTERSGPDFRFYGIWLAGAICAHRVAPDFLLGRLIDVVQP